MTTEDKGPSPILRTAKVKIRVDLLRACRTAAVQPGQSSLRLFRRIVRARFSDQRLTPEEFFRFGLHRPAVTDADCATYLSDRAVMRFNTLLNGVATENDADLLNDKLKTAQAFVAADLPGAPIRGVYLAEGEAIIGKPLRNAAEIAAFLLAPGSTPCFGKPVFGSFSLGVVAVERVVGEGLLELGNGRIVAAADIAAEIVAHYGSGYLFQDLLRASPAIRPLAGPVLPTLRVCTLMLKGAPVPLYAALRLPAAGAMADDGGSGRNARLHIDVLTGAVLRGQDMTRFNGADLIAAPVTNLPLAGQKIDDWPEILRLARNVHGRFPRHACVGTDIALSDRGLVLNEVNASPQHMTYQMVSGKGILNDAFRPLFRAALAEKGITVPQRGTAWPYV